MTKFKYPGNGIYKPNSSYIDGAKNKIGHAVSVCVLNVPSSFAYKSYLVGLNSKLNSLKQEMDVIERLIKKDDSNYKNMSLNIKSNLAGMEVIDIKERDRMII